MDERPRQPARGARRGSARFYFGVGRVVATAGRETSAALYAVIGEALGVAPASLSDA